MGFRSKLQDESCLPATQNRGCMRISIAIIDSRGAIHSLAYRCMVAAIAKVVVRGRRGPKDRGQLV